MFYYQRPDPFQQKICLNSHPDQIDKTNNWYHTNRSDAEGLEKKRKSKDKQTMRKE